MQKYVIMYHSVSGATPAVAGSFPVAFERFRHQVQAIRDKGWSFGRLSRLHEPVDRATVYLTSDDGTVDWAENVLPWCEAEGIPTHTAVITGPWLEPARYPTAHRVQVLLSLPGQALPEPWLTVDQRAYVDRVYAYETDPVRRYLKGACNVIYDDDQAQALLGPPSEAELRLLEQRFAAPPFYRRFKHAEVGVHTVTHQAYSGDPADYLGREVVACREHLVSAGLHPTPIFTLPMRPRFPAVADDLVGPLGDAGFTGMLDGQGLWDESSFLIPRIDAKNVERLVELPEWAAA